jgi:hypothetical protein
MNRLLVQSTAVAAVCALTILAGVPSAQARDYRGHSNRHYATTARAHHHGHARYRHAPHRYSRYRHATKVYPRYYHAPRSRSSFSLSFFSVEPVVRYAPRYYPSHYYRDRGLCRNVQVRLHRYGYYPGPIDGVIGPRSRHAIRCYQRRHGLRVTGTVTRGLLISLRLN